MHFHLSALIISMASLPDLNSVGMPPTRSIIPKPIRRYAGSISDAANAPTIAPTAPPSDIKSTVPYAILRLRRLTAVAAAEEKIKNKRFIPCAKS